MLNLNSNSLSLCLTPSFLLPLQVPPSPHKPDQPLKRVLIFAKPTFHLTLVPRLVRSISPLQCQRTPPGSGRASTRPSQNLESPLVSIDARDLHPPGTPNPGAVAAHLESPVTLLQLERKAVQLLILLLQQVRCEKKGLPIWNPADCLTAAAAAKINADLQARKAIQHVDVPPIQSVS